MWKPLERRPPGMGGKRGRDPETRQNKSKKKTSSSKDLKGKKTPSTAM